MEQTASSSLAVEFEVFLSFRGPDVRRTLADVLHKFLNGKRIWTFLDDEALRKGEKIDGSLAKAIGESRIYIPIFSPGYASSKWCLKELAFMLEHCKKDEARHTILPIFYGMEPRDVRHCMGSYKKGMETLIKALKQSKKYDEETINVWKLALDEVGQIKGWSLKESDGLGALAEKVYSRVWPLVHEKLKLVKHELIGIDYHVNRVMELLKLGSSINIVGIHGIGGIGKTTIAKAVHDKVGTQFECRCFLENVRETQSSETESDAINTLQSKIILSILGEDRKLKTGEGIDIIEKRVRSKQVLIILDDVDEKFKFEQILGEVSKFSSKSRFIITTRDKRVLELLDVSRLHEPKRMRHDHSLRLFRRHAFGMDEPLKDSETLCEKFVEVAAGLPLTLEVIGSLLFRTNLAFWEENLRQLEKILPSKVQEKLRISYDALTCSERKIFLDIACAFIGRNKEYPSYMWEDCGFYPQSGIQTLIWKSLIKVDDSNKFWMHDQLRDLGRTIVHKENIEHPWKRTRIWSNKDAIDMLRNGEGTDQLEVLKVDMDDEDFELTENEFQKFSNLRYLEVHNGMISGDFKNFLSNLRWLELYRCSSVPIDINAKRLVILDLAESNLRDDWGLRSWDGKKEGHKLKAIDLSSCERLTKVPDLFKCPSLERINFSRCWLMGGELDIGHLKDLKVLDVSHTRITKLIGDIGMLQEIHVQHSSLREIYGSNGKPSSLETLDLSGLEAELLVLPTSLKWLTLSSPIPRVPSISRLKDLEGLEWSCETLEIPEDMWKLSKLKHLSLLIGGVALITSSRTLPSSLITLSISRSEGGGGSLESKIVLPNLANLSNLTSLTLEFLLAHEIAGLGELSMLEFLVVQGCRALRNLPSLSKLTKLRHLEIRDCPLLSEIQGLGELGDLEILKINGCYELTEVTGLGKLESLQVLEIRFCQSIKELLDVSALKHLRKLKIERYDQLTGVMGLGKLESLQVLEIRGCASINELPDVSALKQLRRLKIERCRQLAGVMGLDKLESLRVLEIRSCASIKELPDVSALRHLQHLKIERCSQLTGVIGLDKLEALQVLRIHGCASIKELPDVSALKHLRHLKIIKI